MSRVRARDLLVFEALYHPEGQSRGGFLHVLKESGLPEPLLTATEQRLEQRAVHSHPAMAGYALGHVARAADDADLARRLEAAASQLAPLGGSAGDRLFAGHLRPTCAALALLLSALLLLAVSNGVAVPSGAFAAPGLVAAIGLACAGAWWRRRSSLADDATLLADLSEKPWERWIAALRPIGGVLWAGLLLAGLFHAISLRGGAAAACLLVSCGVGLAVRRSAASGLRRGVWVLSIALALGALAASLWGEAP